MQGFQGKRAHSPSLSYCLDTGELSCVLSRRGGPWPRLDGFPPCPVRLAHTFAGRVRLWRSFGPGPVRGFHLMETVPARNSSPRDGASFQRSWLTSFSRTPPKTGSPRAMTLKGRLSSLVPSKDADAQDSNQSLHSILPDHIPASNASGSVERLCPRTIRQPERGSLSLSRHGTPTGTASSTSEDELLLTHRSLDFGRQPRHTSRGSMSTSSLNRAGRGLPSSSFSELADGSRHAERGRTLAENRSPSPRTLSVSRPSQSLSRSGRPLDPKAAALVENGKVVVHARPSDDDPIATVLEVETPDTDGSSFTACARAVTTNSSEVRAASFELAAGVLGVSSFRIVPRFATPPDERARQVAATVASIQEALGAGAQAKSKLVEADADVPSPTAGRRHGYERSRKGEKPRWTVLGVNSDSPSTTLTALALSCRERRSLCEATRVAVATASRAWRRSNVLFIKVTSAMRAQFYFCIAEPSKGSLHASDPATAGASLVNDIMEAVNAAIADSASKIPGAMTLSTMMSFTAIADDSSVSLREEAGGTSTICSLSAPRRSGLLIDTLDAVTALGLHIWCGTVKNPADEHARHRKGAVFKHICLEVAMPDREPIIGSPTEKSLRWRLHQVVETTGINGDSRHVAVIETSDNANVMLGNLEGGKPSLAASMTAHIAKANVVMSLTSRPAMGTGGSSRPSVVLLASNRGELLNAEATTAYAAKAFFDVTGLSGHLDHPDAPATKLPPYPASTTQDFWMERPSDSHSVLPSLPE